MREGEVEPEVAVVAERGDDNAENAELVLFQVKECYVYMRNNFRTDKAKIMKLCGPLLEVLLDGYSFREENDSALQLSCTCKWNHVTEILRETCQGGDLIRLCFAFSLQIPPRKSAASYRADEWDINKWAWEGVLKILSKGESCTIRLEDSKTGELYAQAPVREDQPLPVEAVIDSSRFFVLRLEDTASGKSKHAFVGLGFRERPQAYDFQAALFDHLKYLNKKKEAEEMEQEYQTKPSADYSLKEGETLRLQLKTQRRSSGSTVRSTLGDTIIDSSTATQPMPNPDTPENYPRRLGVNGLPTLAPPPPPPVLQPVSRGSPSPPLRVPSMSAPKLSAPSSMTDPAATITTAVPGSAELGDDADEDFGDFQAA